MRSACQHNELRLDDGLRVFALAHSWRKGSSQACAIREHGRGSPGNSRGRRDSIGSPTAPQQHWQVGRQTHRKAI